MRKTKIIDGLGRCYEIAKEKLATVEYKTDTFLEELQDFYDELGRESRTFCKYVSFAEFVETVRLHNYRNEYGLLVYGYRK